MTSSNKDNKISPFFFKVIELFAWGCINHIPFMRKNIWGKRTKLKTTFYKEKKQKWKLAKRKENTQFINASSSISREGVLQFKLERRQVGSKRRDLLYHPMCRHI
jgi:hypothetical protein